MKDKKPIQLVGEIGINGNGDLKSVKKLIDIASIAGLDLIKFQKRDPNLCVPENQKNKIKETPWGKMTYLEYKYVMEFDKKDYIEIDNYCKEKNMRWFASAWDLDSANFLKDLNCERVKIPSAHLNNHILLKHCRENFKEVHLSTGMSTEKEIVDAIKIGNPDVIYHTNSSYPANVEDLHLSYIRWLKDQYPDKQIGYSGHEWGLTTTFATVAMGVDWIERHICISHDDWGSDQKASIDPVGLYKLVRGIRDIEKAINEGYGPRVIYFSEKSKIESLKYQEKSSI